MTTRPPSLLQALLLWAALTSLAGCAGAGGQTGDEGESSSCDETRSELNLDEVSSLGFSPSDVLRFAEGQHSAAFEWQPSPSVPYGPESGAAQLQLAATGLGRGRLVTRTPKASQDGNERLDCCPDSVEVDVRFELQTAGGALNETFDAVLDARSSKTAWLLHSLKSPFGGTLTFDEQALGAATVEGVQLDVRFGPDDFSGLLHARFEERSAGDDPDGSVSLSIVQLATWGESPTHAPFCEE